MTRGIADVHLQRDGRVFVQIYSRDTAGGWVINGLPRVLPDSHDATALGQAVIDALHASPQSTPPARNYRTDPPSREFLAWLGVDTYAKYAKGVRAVSVNAFFGDDEHILVTPQSNGGARSGFTPIEEHDKRLDDWSPEAVGAAVQKALTQATV